MLVSRSFRDSTLSSETIRVASACWLAPPAAAASQVASASSYGCSENIGILAVVEPIAKFIEIERQIFLADVVVGADNSALQKRPERFHIVRVNVAAHVL